MYVLSKNLLERIAQLEDLCAKKEKFIQSNKMIVKFREDHIVRLERLHKEAGGTLLPKEQEDLLSELREELQTLREQASLVVGFFFSFLEKICFVRMAHLIELWDGWIQPVWERQEKRGHKVLPLYIKKYLKNHSTFLLSIGGCYGWV